MSIKKSNTTVLSLLGIYGIIPLIHSKELLYGTIVHRTAFFWMYVGVAVFVISFTKSRRQLRFSILDISIIAVSLVMLVSAFWGINPENSLWSTYARMMGLIGWFWFVIFYFLIADLDINSVQLRKLLWVAVFVAIISALFGLKDLSIMEHGRLESLFSNPMHAAYFFYASIFICISLVVEEKSKISKSVLYLAILLLLVAALMTKLRGGLLAFTTASLLMLVMYIYDLFIHKSPIYLTSSKRTGLIIGSIIVILAIVFYRFGLGDRYLNYSFTNASISARLSIWAVVIDNLDKIPLLGFGEGNFNYFYIQNFTDSLNDTGTWYDSTHNLFLDKLISYGYIGLVLFLIFYAVIIYTVWNSHMPKYYKRLSFGYFLFHFIFMQFGFESFVSNFFFVPFLIILRKTSAGSFYYEVELNFLGYLWKPIAVTIAVFGLFIGFDTFQNVTNFSAFAFENNINKKVEGFYKTYESSTIGKNDILYEMISQRTSVLQADLSPTEINAYFIAIEGSLKKYLIQHPDDYILKSQLAYLYGDFGEVENALLHFEEMNKIAPERLINNHDYAAFLYQNNMPAKADSIFNYLLNQKKSKVQILLTKARLSRDEKERKNFISQLNSKEFTKNLDLICDIYIDANDPITFFELFKKVVLEGQVDFLHLPKLSYEKLTYLAQSSGVYENVYSIFAIKAGNTLFDPTKNGVFKNKSDSIKCLDYIDRVHRRDLPYTSINDLDKF